MQLQLPMPGVLPGLPESEPATLPEGIPAALPEALPAFLPETKRLTLPGSFVELSDDGRTLTVVAGRPGTFRPFGPDGPEVVVSRMGGEDG